MELTKTHQKEIHDSPLIRQFNEFYREVISWKNRAVRAADSGKTGETPLSESDDGSARPIFLSLLTTLERQAAEARARGGEYGVTFYKDAQYVMAALGDEVFLHTDWEGKEMWKSNLLEFRLFGTYTAGESLFQKIENCIGTHDPSHAEMAAVYFLALSLGFMGKYRGKPDKGELDACRNRLFAFVFQKQPDGFREGNLFPGAYESLVSPGEAKQLPGIRGRIGGIFASAALLAAVSHVVWLYYTYELNQMADVLISKLNLLINMR